MRVLKHAYLLWQALLYDNKQQRLTSPCVFSRLGAMESTSSMKIMEGAFFSASWKTCMSGEKRGREGVAITVIARVCC